MYEADSRFQDEIFLQLVDHAEVFQEAVAERQKRFTEVLSREFFPFEQ